MSTSTTAAHPFFVLGAIDPEMFTLSRVLTDAGVEWVWATTPDVAARINDLLTRAIDAQNCGYGREEWGPLCAEAERLRATPLRAPAQAYACADWRNPTHGATRTHVWVECRPAGADRAALEARGDVVIDHHGPQDPMASATAARAVEASSLGQVFAIARQWACIVCGGSGDSGAEGMGLGGPDGRGCYECDRGDAPVGAQTAAGQRLLASMRETPRWGDADMDAARMEAEVILRHDLRVAGALDHCLYAALRGLVPGVAPNAALRAAAEMAASRELAVLKGTAPEAETPEAFIERVEAAQAVLRAAPRIILGTQKVADLLGHAGKIPALPLAAASAGVAYVVESPARPGVPTTCTIGGAADPSTVEAFAALGREAFDRALAVARQEARHQEEALTGSGGAIGPGVLVVTPDGRHVVVHDVRDGVATVVTVCARSVAEEKFTMDLLRIDDIAARVTAMERWRDQGEARMGVYAFPGRGMAGVYLSAREFARWTAERVTLAG